MPSPQFLKEKLSQVFSPEQAEVLLDVITASYNELVKVGDFSELKEIVRELAQAQKRTEQQVEELAQAQKRTEQRVDTLSIRVDTLTQTVQQLVEVQLETQNQIRELARQVGGLSEAFGASLEDFAVQLVPDLLEKYWNMEIEECEPAVTFTLAQKIVSVDLVIRGKLNNQPAIVLGEVKSNLTLNEAKRFFTTVQQISQENPREFLNKELRVIFFGYRVNKEAKDFIQSQGGYMIFTHGKIL